MLDEGATLGRGLTRGVHSNDAIVEEIPFRALAALSKGADNQQRQ